MYNEIKLVNQIIPNISHERNFVSEFQVPIMGPFLIDEGWKLISKLNKLEKLLPEKSQICFDDLTLLLFNSLLGTCPN